MRERKMMYCVKEVYYGKTCSQLTICYTTDRVEADNVVKAFYAFKKGRPYDYKVERLYTYEEEPYNEIYDQTLEEMLGELAEEYV